MHASLVHIAVNMFSLWFLGAFSSRHGVRGACCSFMPSRCWLGLGRRPLQQSVDVTVGASGASSGCSRAVRTRAQARERGMQLVKANIASWFSIWRLRFSFPAFRKPRTSRACWPDFLNHAGNLLSAKPVRAYVVDAQSGQELESTIECLRAGSMTRSRRSRAYSRPAARSRARSPVESRPVKCRWRS